MLINTTMWQLNMINSVNYGHIPQALPVYMKPKTIKVNSHDF